MSQPSSGHSSINHFDYFTEIEEAFVRHRGTHLLLGPKDWTLISSWKEDGIPLHVVVSGIETVFNRRCRKQQSINSLSYCRGEVENRFAEWLRNQVGRNSLVTKGSTAPKANGENASLPFSRAETLKHLATCRASILAVPDGFTFDGSYVHSLRTIADRLEHLRRDFEQVEKPDFNELESALLGLEKSLDQTLLDHLPPDQSAAWRAEAELRLASYQGRVGHAEYESMLANLLLKRLRESMGMPRLSLFSL